MRYKISILSFLSLLIAIFLSFPAYSYDFLYDIERMQKYNPDGDKYQFLKKYINCLEYLQTNEERRKTATSFTKSDWSDEQSQKQWRQHIIMDNANLRIARNLIKKYKTSNNGFILKTTELFMQFCNNLINLNNEERKTFEDIIKNKSTFSDLKESDLINIQSELNNQRKNILKQLLESSMWTQKVLISSEPDRFGELMSLGVTARQRQRLINKLDDFKGKGFDGEVREGQSFLQASVSAIREMLEDTSWDSLDDQKGYKSKYTFNK